MLSWLSFNELNLLLLDFNLVGVIKKIAATCKSGHLFSRALLREKIKAGVFYGYRKHGEMVEAIDQSYIMLK